LASVLGTLPAGDDAAAPDDDDDDDDVDDPLPTDFFACPSFDV
jgi:hypothetical protein